MRTRHEDKSLSAEAQKVLDAKLARENLTPDEANAVGQALARARAAKADAGWRGSFNRSADPTESEVAEERDALAAYDAAHEESERLRWAAVVARERFEAKAAEHGYFDGHPEPSWERDRARLLVEAQAAERALDRAREDEGRASKALQLVRGTIMRNGHRRQIAYADVL
jgi:hypothetical protein